MAKKFQILLLMLCLGIFILPKQIVDAQTPEISCCEKESSQKDCCKTEKEPKKPCHENEENSCEGNCTKCHTCTISFVFFGITSGGKTTQLLNFISLKKEKYTYLTPEFSTSDSKIWQPPKIG
ncbi:MAG: hypothetical protein K0M56_09530 [Kaistella sp.]|nr:hypothetical protein [Kaistella sp.]